MAAEQSEAKSKLARIKDKATKILGSAIGQAVTLSLWQMRHFEAVQNAEHLESDADKLAKESKRLQAEYMELEVSAILIILSDI